MNDFMTHFNPIRGVDFCVFPQRAMQAYSMSIYADGRPKRDAVERIFQHVVAFSPLICMTPLATPLHVTMAGINAKMHWDKGQHVEMALMTAYIAGLILTPAPVIILAQGIGALVLGHCIYNNPTDSLSSRRVLNFTAICTSIAAMISKNPQVRTAAVALRMANYLLSSANLILKKKYEAAFSNAACSLICGADLYANRNSIFSMIDSLSQQQIFRTTV